MPDGRPRKRELPSPEPVIRILGPQPYAAYAAYTAYTPYMAPVHHNMAPGQQNAAPVQHIIAPGQQNAAPVQQNMAPGHQNN